MSKKRLKRIPLLNPPTPPALPVTEGQEPAFEQPLIQPPREALPAARGGKAKAKKIGKSKLSKIQRSIDRMRWNSKKPPPGGER